MSTLFLQIETILKNAKRPNATLLGLIKSYTEKDLNSFLDTYVKPLGQITFEEAVEVINEVSEGYPHGLEKQEMKRIYDLIFQRLYIQA